MQYLPDILGSGFEAARLDLAADGFSPRSATLIRYLPNQDPKALLPDRVVPDNLRPGGAPKTDSCTVLPPLASPQQPEEAQIYSPHKSQGLPTALQLTPAQQSDVSCLREYLHRELADCGLSVASEWGKPAGKPKFILVYVHGWNDYFYQPHLARMFSQLGAAFYALDLSRYGRNMPQWAGKPWNGYVEDFTDYDPELDWAVANAREEHPGLPLLVMGHSMGGLVVSGWAARHHDDFDGIIFNSPWLVHDVSGVPAGIQIRRLLADYGQEKHFALPQGPDTVYSDSLVGYRAIGSPLPRRLVPFQNDPSVAGWIINPNWRILAGAPTFVGWISAVFQAQRWLVTEATFPHKPVLCLSGNHRLDTRFKAEVSRVNAIMRHRRNLRRSQRGGNPWQRFWQDNAAWLRNPFRIAHPTTDSYPADSYRSTLAGWTEAARHTDMVLNGELIGQRARELFGDNLTFQLLSGYHDLTLSQPLERADFFAEISDWLATSGVLD